MNNKMYKYLIGIITGIGITVIYKYFDLSTTQYIIMLFLAAGIITFIYYKALIKKKEDLEKKINPTLKLLEDGKIDEFIEINTKTFRDEKDGLTKLNIIMYLLVGYDRKQDYKTPRKLMLEIDENSIPNQFLPVYNANLAMLSFKAGSIDEALKIMQENKKEFEKYDATYGDIGVIVAYCRILEKTNRGELDEAIGIIEEKRKHIGDKAFDEEYKLIKKAIKDKEKEDKHNSKKLEEEILEEDKLGE